MTCNSMVGDCCRTPSDLSARFVMHADQEGTIVAMSEEIRALLIVFMGYGIG
jgi:hypothetical protein